jgi:hypothetical protein
MSEAGSVPVLSTTQSAGGRIIALYTTPEAMP